MDTLFIGTNIIRLTEVDSTNSYANSLLKDVKVPEGTLIIAENQKAGRGQRGNIWLSESGANITCSLVLRPEFLKIEEHFLLSKTIAIAISSALSGLLTTGNYDIKIKWPNDILVNNKKIAGILIENNIRSGKISDAIIGFGINVNQKDFGELNQKACSLKTLSQKNYDKEVILNDICKNFEALYLQLRSGKHEQINTRYKQDLLFYKEKNHFTDCKTQERFEAMIEEVQNDGLLVLRLDDNSLRKYEMKEVQFGY